MGEKKKKKKPNIPRRWKMSHNSHLDSAKYWILTYYGKDIVRGYSKHYKTSMLCAAIELKMLGLEVSEERIAKLKRDEEQRATTNRVRREKRRECELQERYDDWDDIYAYLAGYTSWGFPYGVTWEELGEKPPWYDEDDENR
jgi:hypothetical protein